MRNIRLNLGASPIWFKEGWYIVDHKIKKTNNTTIAGDATNIDLPDKSCSVVFCSHVFEHVPHYKLPIIISEINRILKKDGEAIISVWSRWQDKFRQHFIKKCLTNVNRKEFGDIDIYWRQHGLNIPRFYHLYSKRELQNDIKKAGFDIIKIEGVKYFSKKFYDNYFAIVKSF